MAITTKIIKNLPFQLTKDQKSAYEELVNRIRSGKRLNALIQGDVGCGKTILAFLLIFVMADNKKVAKDTVKEFVDAEREKKQKDNTPAYKKEGAHQKQTQSLARNNISQMDKEDVKKMLDSDYFNLGITPKLNQEMDNVLDDIASRQEEIINSGHNIEFDYDEFSEMIEMLMSLEPGDVESDSKIADAISLCQQVAEKFSEL